MSRRVFNFFFFQAEDGIRDRNVTRVQTCALPISARSRCARRSSKRCTRNWASAGSSAISAPMSAYGSARTTTTRTTSFAARSHRSPRSWRPVHTSAISAPQPLSELALRRAELVVGEELHEQRVHVAFVSHVGLARGIEVVEPWTLPDQIRRHSRALDGDAI